MAPIGTSFGRPVATVPTSNWPQAKVKVTAAEIGGTLPITLPGGVLLEMVRISAGSFLMGSGLDSDATYNKSFETPQHLVNISYDFYLGKYEVTQEQWYAVRGTNPSQHTGSVDYPVDSVSWSDCQTFITALNQLGQGTFRLPTEAEWEYACRGGTTTRWNSDFGDDVNQLTNYAWYSSNAASVSHVVGGKLPNPFGLYDMHGNLWEWCEDDYHNTYAGVPTNGSA